MTPDRRALKSAELASSLGAIVLGAGLALVGPELLRAHALPLLLAGLLVHGAGMSLKYRIETRGGELAWWERALFWLCWALLALLAGGLAWAVLSARSAGG